MLSKSLIILFVSLTIVLTVMSAITAPDEEECEELRKDAAVKTCGNYGQTCCFNDELHAEYRCKGDNFCWQQICRDPGFIINILCGTVEESNNVGIGQCPANP